MNNLEIKSFEKTLKEPMVLVPIEKKWYQDEEIQNCAKTLVECGEYLSYARYAKYIPGAPPILNNKVVHFVGDACSVIHSGIKIKSKLDTVLSEETPLDAKIKEIAEVAQVALRLADSQLSKYLPKPVNKTLNWVNNACGVVHTGVSCKLKLDEIREGKGSALKQTKNKVEAAILATMTAKTALDLVPMESLDSVKATLSLSKGALHVAKAGVGTAQYFEGLANKIA